MNRLQENNISRKQMGCLDIDNKLYQIYEGINVIGRDMKATVRMTNTTFSKQHAIISVVDNNTHLLSDFQSSNGTFINNNKLIPYKFYRITDGETITFSDIKGIYHKDTLKSNINVQKHQINSQLDNEMLPTQIITNTSLDVHNLETQIIFNDKENTQINESINVHEAPTQIFDNIRNKNESFRKENNCDIDNESFLLTTNKSKYNTVIDDTFLSERNCSLNIEKNDNNDSINDDIIPSTQTEENRDFIPYKKVTTANNLPKTIVVSDSDSETDIEDLDNVLENLPKTTNIQNNKMITPKEANKNETITEKAIDMSLDSDDDLDLMACTENIPEMNQNTDKDNNSISNENDNKFNDEDDEDLNLLPTQILELPSSKVLQNNLNLNHNPNDDMPPTQLLAVPGKSSNTVTKFKNLKVTFADGLSDDASNLVKQSKVSDNNDLNDDDNLPPTQLLESKFVSQKSKIIVNNDFNDDDLPPTQLLEIPCKSDTTKDNFEFSSPTKTPKSIKKSKIIIDNDLNDDDDLPPTQLLEISCKSDTTKDNFEFSSPTKTPKSIKKSKIIIDNDLNDDDDLPPTQLLQIPCKSDTTKDNFEFSSPTKTPKSIKKSKIIIDNDLNDDDDLPPTQLLEIPHESDTTKDNFEFLSPTKTPKSINKSKIIIDNDLNDDDDLLPTQLLEKSRKSDTTKDLNDDDDLPPTQLLEHSKNIVQANKFSSHFKKLKSARNVETNNDDNDLAPTQLLKPINDNINDELDDLALTQLLHLPKRSEQNEDTSFNDKKSPENFTESVTQKLSKMFETQPSSSSTGSLLSNNDNSMVLHLTDSEEANFPTSKNVNLENNTTNNTKNVLHNTEPETQLEVEFELETQKLYLEEQTSRPNNPLANRFNEENTQLTENINVISKEPKENLKTVVTSDKNEKAADETKTNKQSTSRSNNILQDKEVSKNMKNVEKDVTDRKQNQRDKTKEIEEKSTNEIVEIKSVSTRRTREKTPVEVPERRSVRKKQKEIVNLKKNPEEKEIGKISRRSNIIQHMIIESTDEESDTSIEEISANKKLENAEQLKTPKRKSVRMNNLKNKSDEDSEEVVSPKRKKVLKLEYTQDSESNSSNSSSVITIKTLKRSKKLEGYSDGITKSNTVEIPEKKELQIVTSRRSKRTTKIEDLSSDGKTAEETPKKKNLKVELESKNTRNSTITNKKAIETIKIDDYSSDEATVEETAKKKTLKDKSKSTSPPKNTRNSTITTKRSTRTNQIEDSSSDEKKTPKKNVLEDDLKSIGSATSRGRPKRSMKVEDSSINEKHSSVDATLTTPNTKRRRYEPLDVTLNSAQLTNAISKHKVVFTMLNDESLENDVKKLGGSVVDSINSCTVLVTNKMSRSLKFLVAIALGKPIVHCNWLKESTKKNTFLDPWSYLLEDRENEAKFNCSLKNSLHKSLEKKLLTGYNFRLVVNKNVEVLKELIEVSGGTCITRMPGKKNNKTVFIIAYEEDKAKYSKYLEQKFVSVISAEAIFSGILQQEFNYCKYMLK